MASKKLQITTDILWLIKNLQFDTFEFGDTFNTNQIVDTIKEIESSSDYMQKFGSLRDNLIKLKQQLDFISDKRECYSWGINQWSFWGGTYALEQISLIIGCYDKAIEGTEEDSHGRIYPQELEDYMWGLYDFFSRNMEYILNLMAFYMDKGGLTIGEYIYKDGEWKKSDKPFIDTTWQDIMPQKVEVTDNKSFWKRLFNR